MTRRRIVLVAPGWPPEAVQNGIVTYIGNLRPALAELGLVPHVLAGALVTPVSDPEVSDLERLRGERSWPVKAVDRVLYRLAQERSVPLRIAHDLLAALAAISRSHPFELLEMEESFGAAGYLSRHLRVPLVVRLHGPWFLNGPAVGAPQDAAFHRRVVVEGRGIASACAVTAPSRDVLDRVRREYGLELPHAEVIPNAGPVVAASELWTPSGCERAQLLFVGRFDRHKGGDIVIDAFREVAREDPQVQLLFVGPDRGLTTDGGHHYDLPGYLKERVPEAEVRNRVRVLGPQPQSVIAQLRRRSFASIVPSRYENFAMTVLEALAFGSPIIASDAGGIPEMVRNGESGLTFRTGQAGDLAAQIRLLYANPSLAPALGARGRESFQSRYTPQVVASAAAAFYERILGNRKYSDGVQRVW